jgi:hypothetical protein
MQINSLATAPDYGVGNVREGTLDSKSLLLGKSGSLNNYRLSIETARESWATPRHRHNFDQIRLPIANEIKYGPGLPTLPVGVVAYFPESVRYGPQVRPDAAVNMTVQLGGASANGFLSPEERGRGFEELVSKGRFEKGVFTYQDETGRVYNQDSYEAVWEHIRGRKLVYATPRYTSQIVMDPNAYVWNADGKQPGIASKLLGVFTERRTTISYVRIDVGARWRLNAHAAPQIVFVVTGAVSQGGMTHGRHTAFGLETGEGPVDFVGVEPNELLFIQLPIFTEREESLSATVSDGAHEEAVT